MLEMLLQPLKARMQKSVLQLDPLHLIHVKVLVVQHLLKKQNQAVSLVKQNSLKEKKSNLIDLNWELQE